MDDLPRTRAARFAVSMDPNVIQSFAQGQHAWHETEEEIEEGLAWGEEKEALLRWVRTQCERRLTAVERRALIQYYHRNLSYRQAAAQAGVNPTTIYRAVRRAVRKLKEAAEEENLRPRVR